MSRGLGDVYKRQGSNNISQHQRRFAQETPVQYLNVGNSLDMGAQK